MITAKKQVSKADIQEHLPSTERVQQELATATSMDDFFGKGGMFAHTLELMLEAELGKQLGFERYEPKGRNSGNNRNGHYPKKVYTFDAEVLIQVPRDRNGEFVPQIVPKHSANTNKNVRREAKVEGTAIYIVLGADLDGHRDVLGHWVGEIGESANFWLSVVTDLQARGVKDIIIACMDGLSGFKEAGLAVFPKTQIQRCIIRPIRNSLKYIAWKHRKIFMSELKGVYQAPPVKPPKLPLSN